MGVARHCMGVEYWFGYGLKRGQTHGKGMIS